MADRWAVFGPIIGGFVTQYLGWRWTDWIVMMMTGLALVFSCIMKETYTPVLLQRKAARIRKETDDPRWWSRYDQKAALSEILKTNLTRPLIMAVVEPIWYVLPLRTSRFLADMLLLQHLLEHLYRHCICDSLPLLRGLPYSLP